MKMPLHAQQRQFCGAHWDKAASYQAKILTIRFVVFFFQSLLTISLNYKKWKTIRYSSKTLMVIPRVFEVALFIYRKVHKWFCHQITLAFGGIMPSVTSGHNWGHSGHTKLLLRMRKLLIRIRRVAFRWSHSAYGIFPASHGQVSVLDVLKVSVTLVLLMPCSISPYLINYAICHLSILLSFWCENVQTGSDSESSVMFMLHLCSGLNRWINYVTQVVDKLRVKTPTWKDKLKV